jgi:hypothetical protein
LAKASDGAVEVWSPPAEAERSPRQLAALRLAELVEKRIAERDRHLDVPLDSTERAVLLGEIGAVIGDVILLDQLCREHWGKYAGLPREGEASEEARATEIPAAPADMSNVRRLDNLPGGAGLRSKRPLPLN